jgi:sugar/nucleoside kinase (ribokinase family)
LFEQGVDVAGIANSPLLTLRWTGRYGRNTDQRECVERQAQILDDYLPEIPRRWRSTPLVFLAADAPHQQLAALQQLDRPHWVAADTMDIFVRSDPEDVKRVAAQVDLFLCNADEAAGLTGRSDPAEAAVELQQFGPQAVVVKHGSHGSVLRIGEGRWRVPSWPLERCVDPTGAGDSFAGGLLGHLARAGDLSPETLRGALYTASSVGAFNCEDVGSRRIEVLSRDEVEARRRALEASV